MTQEIIVVLEETEPDIVVQILDPTPSEVQVVVQETGFAGTPGLTGPPGPVGPPGDGNTDAVVLHIADETPHSVYDDGPSLILLYQNAKV